jgi:hypothetical protein
MHARRGNIYCDDNGCDIIRSSYRSYQRVVVSFIVVAVAAAATGTNSAPQHAYRHARNEDRNIDTLNSGLVDHFPTIVNPSPFLPISPINNMATA